MTGFRETYFPAVGEWAVAFLVNEAQPDERKALAEIVTNGDLLIVDGKPWLLVPASDALLDRLAALDARNEDTEDDLCDEPEPVDETFHDDEPDTDREPEVYFP